MTTFALRDLSSRYGRPYWEIIATTKRGYCYRLGHAESDEIHDAADFTREYATRLWKECRRQWLPDNWGGANAKELA
jgi:hypothetical protein